MADFKMHHAVLVFAVIGLYHVHVIHMAEADIESKVDYLEYRFDRLLKNEIADLEDNLRTIQNDKPDHACCKTEQQPVLNQTSGDGIQRLVNEVTAKTKAMLTAFSTEKKQLQRQRTYLNEALGVIRVSVEDHENQTRDSVDQLKDNHHVDFEQLKNKIEFVRQQGQQKCYAMQELVKTQLLNKTELELETIRVTIDDRQTQSLDLVEQLENKHRVDFEQLMNKIELVGRQSQQKYDSVEQLVEKHSAEIDSMKSNIDGITRIINSLKEIKQCKEGWIRQLGSCVLYVDTEKKTWSKAQDHCNDLGGFLVEPHFSLPVTVLIGGESDSRYWIGASDQAEEGVWRWESTGRKIGRVPIWNKGEPNDAGGEDCAELLFRASAMNDINCGTNRHFICEIKL